MYFQTDPINDNTIILNTLDLPLRLTEPSLTFPLLVPYITSNQLFNDAFKTSNLFIMEQSEFDQVELAMFYILSCDTIKKAFATEGMVDLIDLTTTIGERLRVLESRVALLSHISDFVDSDPLIQLVMLCKVLAPVFNTLRNYSHTQLLAYDASYCTIILAPIRAGIMEAIDIISNKLISDYTPQWEVFPDTVRKKYGSVVNLIKHVLSNLLIEDFIRMDISDLERDINLYVDVYSKYTLKQLKK